MICYTMYKGEQKAWQLLISQSLPFDSSDHPRHVLAARAGGVELANGTYARITLHLLRCLAVRLTRSVRLAHAQHVAHVPGKGGDAWSRHGCYQPCRNLRRHCWPLSPLPAREGFEQP